MFTDTAPAALLAAGALAAMLENAAPAALLTNEANAAMNTLLLLLKRSHNTSLCTSTGISAGTLELRYDGNIRDRCNHCP